MGPFNEDVQTERAQKIASLLLNNRNQDTQRIWEQHLRNLCKNENEYNARVVQIYSGNWK